MNRRTRNKKKSVRVREKKEKNELINQLTRERYSILKNKGGVQDHTTTTCLCIMPEKREM